MAAPSSAGPPLNQDELRASFGFNDGREKELRDWIFARPDVETSLRNNPGAVLAAMDEFIRTKGMMTLGVTKITKCGALLAELDPPPKILIELGTYVGQSAIGWGDILRSLNAGAEDQVKVYCMEIDDGFASIARDLIELAGLSGIVTVLVGPAAANLRSLKETQVVDKVDVLFLDHWQEAYLPDTKIVEELGLLRKGSVILADNTDVPGTPDFNAWVKDQSREGGVKYQNVEYVTEAKIAKIISASTVIEVP